MYFDSSQISLVKGVFSHAEKLAAAYFRLGHKEMKEYRYEVKTLPYLEDHEINDSAFAHLCKYYCQKHDERDSFQFFRVCLQDNRILNAVERANSFIRLAPLMLYIATHEIVHIVRFNKDGVDFDAPLRERIKEEEKVHYITRDMLGSLDFPDMGLITDCFSNKYLIDNVGAI